MHKSTCVLARENPWKIKCDGEGCCAVDQCGMLPAGVHDRGKHVVEAQTRLWCMVQWSACFSGFILVYVEERRQMR